MGSELGSMGHLWGQTGDLWGFRPIGRGCGALYGVFLPYRSWLWGTYGVRTGIYGVSTLQDVGLGPYGVRTGIYGVSAL